MKAKMPEPETKEALLPSFGYGPGLPRITRHVFTRALECHLPGEGEAWEFLYKCEETGVERRWGTWFEEEGN